MLDFERISTMNVNEYTNYVSTLDLDKLSVTERNLLNMANGFILCRDLSKMNLTEDQISKIFKAALVGNQIQTLEAIYQEL